jgi:hypothetical protein
MNDSPVLCSYSYTSHFSSVSKFLQGAIGIEEVLLAMLSFLSIGCHGEIFVGVMKADE